MGEREREREKAGHDHVGGGKSPRGREVRVCGRAESKEREEGQVAPLIVSQISGVGHTWLLPGRCGVELRQNHNTHCRKRVLSSASCPLTSM